MEPVQLAHKAKHKAYVGLKAVRQYREFAVRGFRGSSPGLPRTLAEAGFSLQALAAMRERGWQRSVSGLNLTDGHGRPYPWWPYPLVDFMAQMSLSRMKVLEFGAGSSTPWLGRRVKYLLSVEDNVNWFERLEAPRYGDLVLRHCDGDWYETDLPCEYVSAGDHLAPWDLIIVDGKARRTCAAHALKILGVHGAVIVDDTQVSEMDEVRELMQQSGLVAIDFVGLRPGLGTETTSTLFARNLDALFH